MICPYGRFGDFDNGRDLVRRQKESRGRARAEGVGSVMFLCESWKIKWVEFMETQG